jgi:CheY-like chemotaxis protein
MITGWQAPSSVGIPLFGDPKWIEGDRTNVADKREGEDEDRKIRIIVVDDEAVIAETVVEILNQEGFEATAVTDGDSAVELAKTVVPDVLLSDVIMPGLNGIETGMKIRELVPKCKIILFSGQAATVDLLEEARLQGHRFEILAKPISPEKLIAVIRASSGYLS